MDLLFRIEIAKPFAKVTCEDQSIKLFRALKMLHDLHKGWLAVPLSINGRRINAIHNYMEGPGVPQ